MSDRVCPDDGTCHHDCGSGGCFRVACCVPLTAYGEVWSDADKDQPPYSGTDHMTAAIVSLSRRPCSDRAKTDG